MGRREELLPVDIREEMQQSYLDYAMSVIVGRALPDVRDGLKPVHRRVLYTMREMNLSHSRPHRKAARLVGEVMGKYHPHGDAAIYESVVRMAQDFSLRYPLVDGQGNFGSIDGDPPAAMRYTETRMAPIAQEVLADIDKETVDFGPNYDDSLQEPLVLPARLPNLLVNGSSGIAVGMATNIPPHNLGEVVDGLVTLLEDSDCSVDGLMEVVHGPDFPTGAYICGRNGIEEAYRTGRGILRLRARAITERDQRGGKERIIITEIPYQVVKARLIEKIADLVRAKKVDAIADIRDESDRSGMRIVIELRRDAVPDAVLAQLYAQTPLQSTFGIIFLALVRNQPRVLNLKELLSVFIDHRQEVVYRRTTYELRKAEDRAHVLEGLRKAIDQIDRVVQLIRKAASPEAARQALIRQLELSAIQAQAILDMRLQRLTGLERKKIVDEYGETIRQIERLSSILASDQRLRDLIKEELLELKERYGDGRRTEIVPEVGEISLEDMIAEEDMVVTVSHTDYIKRNPISLYRSQRRGGKGKIGMDTKEEDFVEHLFVASTHDYILFFTNRGKIHWLKVYGIPQAGRAAKGKAIVNLLQLSREEHLSAMIGVKDFSPDRYLLMATRNGFVKRTSIRAYARPQKGGIIALTLGEGDELISVRDTDGTKDVFIGTHHGKAIRFSEVEVRPMGRMARGVIGIRLDEGDVVVSANVVEPGATVLAVTENGYGKRTAVEDYRRARRGGRGVINIKTSKRNGYVVGMRQVYDDDELMMITANGMVIRLAVGQIRVIGRATQGVRLIDVAEGDRVVSIARLAEER